MDKPVLISILGRQNSEDGGAAVELITPGRLARDGDAWVLTYEESDPSGALGISTTLLVEGQRVTMARQGTAHSFMVFEQGQRHLSYYDMAEGGLTVGVHTRSLGAHISEAGGQIELCYHVDLPNRRLAESSVRVKIDPVGGM